MAASDRARTETRAFLMLASPLLSITTSELELELELLLFNLGFHPSDPGLSSLLIIPLFLDTFILLLLLFTNPETVLSPDEEWE